MAQRADQPYIFNVKRRGPTQSQKSQSQSRVQPQPQSRAQPQSQSRVQPQLLQFSNAQTQSQTHLNQPRIFNTTRRANPTIQPKRKVQAPQLQRPNSQGQSQSFQSSQSVRLNEPFVFARRRGQPNASTNTNTKGASVNSRNAQAKNTNVKNSNSTDQTFAPTVRRAWNTSVQQSNNVQKQELQGYLKLLNCKYPGHTQANCSYPPPFNANLAQWGDRLRADYPPTSPQEQAMYADKEKFTDAYMVRRYGTSLGMQNPARTRAKPNWAQGARMYGH